MLFLLKQRIRKIKTIVFDFDGVMTDNTVIVDQFGNEAVIVSRADGLGITILRELGYSLLILSSEQNQVVSVRSAKLGVPCITASSCKGEALKNYMQKDGLLSKEIMYVGNDYNDISAFALAGCIVTPSDAHHCVKRLSNLRLKTPGGAGVVRELAEVMKKHSQQ